MRDSQKKSSKIKPKWVKVKVVQIRPVGIQIMHNQRFVSPIFHIFMYEVKESCISKFNKNKNHKLPEIFNFRNKLSNSSDFKDLERDIQFHFCEFFFVKHKSSKEKNGPNKNESMNKS